MFCRHCGKEIDDKAVVCIYCGIPTDNKMQWAAPQQQQGQQWQQVEQKKVNAFGIAGFVVSLVSLWLGFLFCIASIVGLVLSIVGMVNMKKCKVNGLAIAGLVIGIVSVFLWSLWWIVFGSILGSPFFW